MRFTVSIFYSLTDDVIHTIGTIGPNAEFKYVLEITGTKLGKYTVVIGLSSDKIEHVTGEMEVRAYACSPYRCSATIPKPYENLCNHAFILD